MILYVETNLIIAAAKGQDARILDLWDARDRRLKIVMPGMCVMEALSVFDAERKARNRFTNELQTQITQVGRDATSRNAASLLSALREAHLANSDLLNDIEARLVYIMERLSGMHSGYPATELIALRPDVLRNTLGQTPSAMLNPTDALILETILNPARTNDDSTKAVLTGNTNDFATPEARRAMTESGIEYFFPNAEAVLGWLQGQPEAAL